MRKEGNSPTYEDIIEDVENHVSQIASDKDFLDEILALYLEDVPRKMENMALAFASEDPARIAKAAHKLTGFLSGVRTFRAVEYSRRLEETAKSGDLEKSRRMHPRLVEIVGWITDYIEKSRIRK